MPVDRIATQRLLNELAMDMTRTDAEITQAQYSGNRVGAGWDTWFSRTANKMLDARDAYALLNPQDVQLAMQLRQDALDLSHSAGELNAAFEHGHTFGSGWSETLDRKIADVSAAVERLYSAPTYPGNPGAPVPQEPPVEPAPPSSPVDLAADVKRAADLVSQSIKQIRTVPKTDKGDASTKDVRLSAFHLNLDAQKLLEQHMGNASAEVGSTLRTVDAQLEDAGWQLAKKPSPDGRFNGVDIPGALRDSSAALKLLKSLGASL